jgi:addiction module RelE/StbE family toxin
MKVRFSPRSIADLDNIRRYVAKDNPAAAWVVASFIRQTIRHLEHWPYQGRATDVKDVRRIVVVNYPYVVFYHVNDERVLILEVVHTSRDR